MPPLGLSSVSYVFTKVLKPLEKYWRIQGVCIAMFLDDDWAIVQDRKSCRIKARAVRRRGGGAVFCIKRVLLSTERNRYGNPPNYWTG